ncbi:flagellar hook assembly protein FlgD [Jatrophihabitans sp. DSM 45814]
MTTPITSGLPATPTPVLPSADTAASSTDNTQLDSKEFLQLLVAQLQYQDPSKPVDTSEFMNETATLTQVQTMEANAKATQDMLNTQQAQTASGMVGRTVTYLDSAGHPVTGEVTSATISNVPPSLRIGTTDVALTQIQQVFATSAP